MKKALSSCIFLLLLFVSQSFAQNISFGGQVLASKSKTPLEGATVHIEGTTHQVQTDKDGKFSFLTGQKFPVTVTVTFIGHLQKQFVINDSKPVSIALDESSSQLGEIVVTGYTTQTKKEFTGAAATVKSSQLQNRPAQSFDQLLGGQAAGVDIIQPSSALNNTPVLRIRGINSITSSVYPLIVVDGVTVFTGSAGGSVGNDPLSDINPADIETIDILKDASAASIYGSRAANGVLVITTKKGKKGKAKVAYDGWVSFSKPFNPVKMLNAYDYVTIKNEARVNAGLTPGFALQTNADGNVVNTNWADVAYHTGLSHNHNVNVSGASEATSYYLSLNYTDQEGIIRTNTFKRMGARLNLEHALNRSITIGTNASFGNSINKGPNTGAIAPNSVATSTGNSVNTQYIGTQPIARLIYILPPNVSVYNADGTYNINQSNGTIGYGANSPSLGVFNAWNLQTVLDYDQNTSENNTLIGSVYAEVKLLKGLKFKTTYGIDNLVVENKEFRNPFSGDGFSATALGGSASNSNTRYFRSNWTNTLAYATSFNNSHNLSVLVAHEEIYRKIDGWGATRSGLSDPFYVSYQGGWTNITPANNIQTENGLLSYFSNLSYDYQKKYLLNFNFRRDGLSALAAGNKWGNFGGGSAGWNISEESFYQHGAIANIINNLKVRVSYGVVGNSSLNDYASLSQYNSSTYAGVATLNFSQAGNTSLKWEQSKKTDVGLSFSLLNNRINIEADYYKNTINGLILNAPVASSLGIPGNSIAANVGSLYNKGIELAISANVLTRGKFQWNASLNFATLKNKVTSLGAGGDIYPTVISTFGIQNVTRVGYSVGSIFAVPTTGVNPDNGNRVYINRNNEEVQYNAVTKAFTYLDGRTAPGIDNYGDGRIFGPSLPTYFGGFNNNLSYGNFDLQVGFTFSGGNKIYNGTRGTTADQRYFNSGTFVLNRWQKAGDVTDIPKLVWGDSFSPGFSSTNSANVEDGSFVKLKNLLLSYRVPVKNPLISSARVYVQGSNLFTITKYRGSDPEVSINGNSVNGGKDQNVPVNATVLTIGLNVGF